MPFCASKIRDPLERIAKILESAIFPQVTMGFHVDNDPRRGCRPGDRCPGCLAPRLFLKHDLS